MTEKEFADWQQYHNALFPRFDDWMLGMLGPGGETEPQEIVDIRERAFRDALEGFEVDAVKGASYELFKAPIDQQPKYFDKHCAAILEILRRPKGGRQIARPRVECELCGDRGILTVTAKPGLALLSAAGLPLRHGTEASVDCTCKAGKRMAGHSNVLQRDVYDPSRMERVVYEVTDTEAKLEDLSARSPMGARLARVLDRFLRT